ncbi:lipopolysaccharide assembly protein LapA domain-containing protein [Azospira oryzae]|uniref:lipopolysaccharide assembly protein LapA domain-containing protein n=1 Tax=Azospira oryzae TaxID=146939 RepID=UPI0011D6CC39|nr:LapA family protein [Azospira oryzae]TXH15889.1 MAG: LapA family protein [Gammaproteobacteria bacterium]
MKRYFHIALIVVFTTLVLLFKVQNIDNVTVSLLTWSVTLPLSLLLIGVYVLGMLTGSALVGLLRESVRGAQHK